METTERETLSFEESSFERPSVSFDLDESQEENIMVYEEVSEDVASSVFRQRTAETVVRSAQHEVESEHDERPAWNAMRPHPLVERKRIKSWASEGEAHRVLRRSFDYDYEYDTDYDTDREDFDDREEEEDDTEFFAPPRRRTTTSSRPFTASALALRHGSFLRGSQPRLALPPQPDLDIPIPTEQPYQQQPTAGSGKKRAASSPRKVVPNPWLIPADHPLKILWDVLTVVLSIANAYLKHRAILNRQFQSTPGFIEVWFVMDIVLNFMTQRTTSDGTVLTTFMQVWARYLTSWFVIDVLALFPGEVLYIQPVIELQKRRKFWNKVFRRTKVTVKVTTRILQSGHVPWLYKCLVKVRHPIRGLVQLIKWIVRYIPKYVMFVRNMKGIMVIRALRDLGHFRAAWRATSSSPTAAAANGGEEPAVMEWTSDEDDGHLFGEEDEDDEDDNHNMDHIGPF